MTELNPNQTSAKLLLSFATKKFSDAAPVEFGVDSSVLSLIAADLYIKARSYSILNKCAFWVALVFSILVITWPTLSIFAGDFGVEKTFLKSAIVQTSVTALAALSFAIYAHYKKRQMMTENLLRLLVTVTKKDAKKILAQIIAEIERIDHGFSFNSKMKDDS